MSDASPQETVPITRAPDTDRLIKQTYSVIVTLPEDRSRGLLRKWHLSAFILHTIRITRLILWHLSLVTTY